MGSENLTRDLFGDVTTMPSGRRGRPAHRWSQNAENRVTLGLAMGYSDAEIAKGLGISPPTLRKYYFSALQRRDMQRLRFEMWRAEVLAEQANAGNTGALKELGKILEKRDRHIASEKLKAGDEAAAPIGKKQQRQADAQAAVQGDDLLKPGYH